MGRMEKYLSIDLEVLSEIRHLLREDDKEAGGIIGGTCKKHISIFYHDVNANSDRNEYFPCFSDLYAVIDIWHSQGIWFLGFIHTHPSRFPKLSMADMAFAKDCIRMNSKIDFLYMGILTKEQLCLNRIWCRENSIRQDEYILHLKSMGSEMNAAPGKVVYIKRRTSTESPAF